MKLLSLLMLTSLCAFSANKNVTPQKKSLASEKMEIVGDAILLKDFKLAKLSPKKVKALKAKVIAKGPKAVPTLIKVMKTDSYPDRNRWIATFLLGRVMGKKASPFIAKFSTHPNWMLRLASLKSLLALGEAQYKGIYARALKDKAMIVRYQALENIKKLKIKSLAPYVWAMLYDKANYAGMKGKSKRTHIIKEAIRTVGDLDFDKAKKPLFSMVANKKYKDVFDELDYALSKIIGKTSPEGNPSAKRFYWQRIALKEKTI
jgi:hypothetical protein